MIYKLLIMCIIITMIYYIDKIKNWRYLKPFKYPIIIFLIYLVMYASTLNFSRVSVYKDDRNLVFYNNNSILVKNKGLKIENIEKIAKYSNIIIVVFNKDNEKYVLSYESSDYFKVFKENEDIFPYSNTYNIAKKTKEFMNFKIFKLKYTERERNENR